MNETTPDDQLLAAFGRGDDAAFATLVERHGAAIKTYALRMLRNAEAAEDVYVETFTRVAAQRGRWTPGGTVRGYLFTIAHRLCIDVIKRRQREIAGQAQVIELETHREVAASPEAVAILDQTAAALERAIAQLPEAHRQVLLLRVVHELSTEETAAIVGLGEEQVRSQLSYARKQLRVHLAEGAAPRRVQGGRS
jgi:RNA polymerase sigma-70 factor (ECF subfamily)